MRTIPLAILGICSSLFKWNYLKNEKLFLNFLFHLWDLHQLSSIFKKQMIVRANVFPKLNTVKDLVKPLSRKHHFRTSFDSQRVNGCQTILKFAWEHFYHTFWSLWVKMICKISPLLKFEIWGVFVNTFTADDKYPVRDCENLQFIIEVQLS